MMFLIDTHRHFGGCQTTHFVWQALRATGSLRPDETYQSICDQMQFTNGSVRGFEAFLDKFRILDRIPWTEDLIDMSVRDACAAIAIERIDYCLLDFSVDKYLKMGWSMTQAIKFIIDAFRRHSQPNRIGLLLSLKYEGPASRIEDYVKLLDTEISADLVGIDLVGDESQFEWRRYRTLFRAWRDGGKMARAHVGETQPVNNVINAIINLAVTNIAHGIAIVTDCDAIKLAKDCGVIFDVALTSNRLTGAWNVRDVHPFLAMLDAGLCVTIGSDDPVQCNTSLTHEFNVAKRLGASTEHLAALRHNAFTSVQRLRQLPALTDMPLTAQVVGLKATPLPRIMAPNCQL